MDVIGELVKMGDRAALPLPWYSRGHLGMESGTSVSVGFTKPKDGFLPDIIISPYDLRNLACIRFFSIESDDKRGFISDLQAELTHHNITMSESVTTIGRDSHRAGITLELTKQGDIDKIAAETLQRLQELYGEKNASMLPPAKEFSNGFSLIFDKKVTHAQVTQKFWQKSIREIAGAASAPLNNYDLSRLVVSSNTDFRFMRFMVPRAGTKQIYVGHTDQPAAANAIMSEIASLGINVLAHRISPTNDETEADSISTLVMACEPSNSHPDPFEGLEDRLHASNVQMLAGTTRVKINDGTNPLNTLYVTPKSHFLVGAPTFLREEIKKIRQTARKKQRKLLTLSSGEYPKYVFISHKFHHTPEKEAIRNALKKALNAAGCYWIEAPFEQGARRTYEVLKAKMWSADAVVAIAFDPEGNGKFEGNQGNELGFYEGQRKRRKVICASSNISSFKTSLTNEADPILITYDNVSDFVNEESKLSIYTEIKKWVTQSGRLERGGAEFD